MIEWVLVTVLLLALIAIFAPHLLAVDLHKLSLIALGAVAGYWFDRALFPYGRPDRIGGDEIMVSAAMLRRSIIVGSSILAVSLGA